LKIPYSVLRELQDLPDREQLVLDNPKMTVREAIALKRERTGKDKNEEDKDKDACLKKFLEGFKAASKNCYVAQTAGTETWPFAGSAGIHDGVTVTEDKRRIFNGKLTVAPDRHPVWMMPMRGREIQTPSRQTFTHLCGGYVRPFHRRPTQRNH